MFFGLFLYLQLRGGEEGGLNTNRLMTALIGQFHTVLPSVIPPHTSKICAAKNGLKRICGIMTRLMLLGANKC